MKWRNDGGKKTFMERLVNLAADRVRRNLMPKLRKKVRPVSKDDESHKKKHKKHGTVSVFNPDIHVKQEPSSDECSMENLTVLTSDDRDVSSITDKEQEISVIRKLKKYYKDNNTTQLPLDFFEACLDTQSGYHYADEVCVQESTEKNETNHEQELNAEKTTAREFVNEPNDMNDMNKVGSEIGKVPNYLLNPGSKCLKDSMPPLPSSKTEEMGEGDGTLITPFKKCVDNTCEFVFEVNSNPHQTTIEKDFGIGLKCVGLNCEKSLLECFRNKYIGGAHICRGCKKGKCKHVYCSKCFQNTTYAKQSRTRRMRSGRQSE